MVRNGLTSVHGELSDLPCLRSVIVRHNTVSERMVFLQFLKKREIKVRSEISDRVRTSREKQEKSGKSNVVREARRNGENSEKSGKS